MSWTSPILAKFLEEIKIPALILLVSASASPLWYNSWLRKADLIQV